MKHFLILLLLLILLVAVKVCNAQQYTLFGVTNPGNDITTNYGAATDFGFRFKSSVAGYIWGVKFYKTTGNTGTHIGEIYSPTGVRLAQAVFTSETASGWQTVMFSTPVAITLLNQLYTASYYSSFGNVSATANQFNNAITSGPITAPANVPTAFIYTAQYSQTGSPSYPNQASTNGFWVDLIFSTSLPLPVHYLYFDALKKNNDVQLKWATSMEENNKGFEIQRSHDSVGWSAIAFVQGIGNSQAQVDYEYVDPNLTGGDYFYRLKQIDLDGKFDLSKVVHVAIDYGSEYKLFSYLNSIALITPKAGLVQLVLYDGNGHVVQMLMNEFKLPGRYDVQVRGGLKAGIYYYRLNTLSQSLVRKLVVY